MKKAVYFLLPLTCLLFQCAHHEKLTAPVINPEIEKECLSVYPAKPFRAVHKIEANLPFGGYGAFIGVTEIHPDTGLIKTILLSPEGITLLDTEGIGSEITINSGIPPLNNKDFAAMFSDDIRFLFMQPKGKIESALTLQNNSCSCSWTQDKLRIELQKGTDRTVLSEIKGSSRIIRQAIFLPPLSNGLYSKMIFETKGIAGYRLTFELLKTENTGN